MLRTYIEGAVRAVAIKYRREGFRKRTPGAQNPYDVRFSIFSRDPRRRLILIYVGIMVMTILLLAFHFVTENSKVVWLPPRIGEAWVVEKRIENKGRPQALYLLFVRVAVPSRDGVREDADSGVDGAEGDGTRTRELSGIVVASEEDWRSVEPGSAIGVKYRVDAAYKRIAIDAVYSEGAPQREE